MQFSVKLQGDFIKKIGKADAQARAELGEGLADASTHLFQRSIEAAPSSTGALRQGMRRELDKGALTAAIYPSSRYAIFVHGPGGEGRTKPHMIPGKEAQPGGSLYRWAKKNGMNPWAVRAAIAKRGTKFNPFLERTADAESGKVLAIIQQSIQNIGSFLAD